MISCSSTGMYYARGQWVPADESAPAALAALGFLAPEVEAAHTGTIAWNILQAHNTSGDPEALKLKFDAMASHDITFVGIVQTARASGLTRFPMPYVLTNCHNSLCAVGGTINEDDHLFGLSAAKKYGGIYVPPHLAVIHQYMREMQAGCGKMILGSDSHTRYGALGTMAIGEGGGELAKQLLGRTYDVARPGVVAVHLTGAPAPGVGPQDVALAIIGAVFKNGYVKNKVMEFVGPGVASLPLEYRSGVDVMTTETTCLSSVWVTDGETEKYLAAHGRAGDYKPLAPAPLAYYDGLVEVELGAVKPMIALPMHPSNVYTIEELNANLADILHKTEEDCAALMGGKVRLDLVSKIENGRLRVDQGVIAGCAGGTYSNICEAAQILAGHGGGNGEYALSVYPSSQPTMMALMKNGALTGLMAGGATVRTAFCGPCFGAGDVPANGALSIRHTTRNFPSREGSKPGSGQIAGVALMDARSIAATTLHGGILTPATEVDYDGLVEVELGAVKPMIALPMHPSNVYTIEELNANLADILHKTEEDCAALMGGKVRLDLVSKIENGRLRVDQGVIAGCAGGTYSNICEAAQILAGHGGGNGEYALSVYPSSQPTMMALMKNGALTGLMAGGATVRTAFCGPCFGAGDVPANGALSIRHTTRNFPSREGSKPGSGQIAGVALMDARSIAATTLHGGILTPATEVDYEPHIPAYEFDDSSYKSRVYNGYGKGDYDALLRLGPNIKNWPDIQPLPENLLLKVTSFITDPVTTTDELIPSGETSSYRSNPLGLAEFTLSRKDPEYVGRAKAVQAEEAARAQGKADAELLALLRAVPGCEALEWGEVGMASTIYAVKPGDGSAREQAASCQRVLGAGANIAVEYATKRYRSNLINWGMLPFQLAGPTPFELGDAVLVPGIRARLEQNQLSDIPAWVLGKGGPRPFTLTIAPLTADERQILLDGCLINYYKRG